MRGRLLGIAIALAVLSVTAEAQIPQNLTTQGLKVTGGGTSVFGEPANLPAKVTTPKLTVTGNPGVFGGSANLPATATTAKLTVTGHGGSSSDLPKSLTTSGLKVTGHGNSH